MSPYYLNGVNKDDNATEHGRNKNRRRPAHRSAEDRAWYKRHGKKRARKALNKDLQVRLLGE